MLLKHFACYTNLSIVSQLATGLVSYVTMSIQETERGVLLNGGEEGKTRSRIKGVFFQCKRFGEKLVTHVREKRYCWKLMWLMILLLIVWPLALVAAFLYVVLTTFRACCECTTEITQFLYKGILLPLIVARFMVDARSCEGL